MKTISLAIGRAWRVALVLMLFAGTAAAERPGDFISLNPEQQSAYGIRLERPGRVSGSLTRRYPGTVAVPNQQLRVVVAPRAGNIEALLVAEGEPVSAGQVLATIASPELIDVQSNYLETLTRLDLAETEHERNQTLHKEGIIAERRLLASRAEVRELRTLAEQRRQMLVLSGMDDAAIATLVDGRRLSSSLAVRSPIGGVVLQQMATTGQSLPASAPLYRVAELSPLWVEIHVPVERLAGIAPGTGALLPGLGIEGRVITVGRKVHEEDQGVLVRAEVRDGAERLRPGQFIEVQLRASASGADAGGWRVPTAAVVRSGADTRVFVAGDGGFLALPVRLLAQEEQSAVVAADLGADDRLAVSGVAALKAAWLAGAAGEQ